jgi:5-methylcytosine-specific restriction endonuclease McrA
MSRVSLSVKHARALWGLLPNVADVSPDERMAMAALEAALKPRPVSSQRKKTAAKRRTRKAETSAIYEEVAKRAGGKCEACEEPFSPFAYSSLRPELDHFFGRGRGQSVVSCWLICARCHHAKSKSVPSAGFWLHAFIRHAEKHSYMVTAEKARARLEGIVAMRAEGAR